MSPESSFKNCMKIEFNEAPDERVPPCNYFAYDISFRDRFRDFADTDRLFIGVSNDF